MQIHVVQPRETLWSISVQYGVSVNQIVAANGLENPGQLVIGQSLVIPDKYPSHTVQPGQTLSIIARYYGTSVQAILAANQIQNPSMIYAGQTIVIPVLYHTVRRGETLSTIAQSYGTTAQAIAQANRITNPSLINVGQRLIIPQPAKPQIEVNGFMTQYGLTGGQTVRQYARYLTYVSAFAYRIQPDGGLQPVDDAAITQAVIQTGVTPMLMITNFSSTETGTALAHTILVSPSLQDTLLTNVISTMMAKGYKGLNIDFENVSPNDKDAYNQFLQRAVDRLHPEGYFVSSSLAPKISAAQQGLLYEAHDYPAHGRILDFVVLMTYEWGWRYGPPQAISPINQIQQVLDYAVTVIPRNKIMMGFQVYARDWVLPHVQGQEAETFDTQEAIRRAIRYGVTIQYDQPTQSPFFRYTDAQGTAHEVWFEDARCAQAKFNLVKQYNLRGISYWVLEFPFPANWTLLQGNFAIKKISG